MQSLSVFKLLVIFDKRFSLGSYYILLRESTIFDVSISPSKYKAFSEDEVLEIGRIGI